MNSPYAGSSRERLKAFVMAGLFAVSFVVLLPWHIASEHHHDFPDEVLGHCVGVSEQGNDDHESAHALAEHDWSALPNSQSQGPSDSRVQGVANAGSSFSLSWLEQGDISADEFIGLRPPYLIIFRLRGPPLS